MFLLLFVLVKDNNTDEYIKNIKSIRSTNLIHFAKYIFVYLKKAILK